VEVIVGSINQKVAVPNRSVPVELRIRSRKLKEVRSSIATVTIDDAGSDNVSFPLQLAIMTSVGTSCFMTRCALQILLATEKRQLHDRGTWLVVVVYYALLEILPTVSVLYFNRRLPQSRRVPATRSPIRGGRLFGSKAFEADDDGQMTKSLLRN
jgi:hypothetical protein